MIESAPVKSLEVQVAIEKQLIVENERLETLEEEIREYNSGRSEEHR